MTRRKDPIWEEYDDEDVRKGDAKTAYRKCKHCGVLVCAVATRLKSHYLNVCKKRPRSVGRLVAGSGSVRSGSNVSSISSRLEPPLEVLRRGVPLHAPDEDILESVSLPRNPGAKRMRQSNLVDKHGVKKITRSVEEKNQMDADFARAIHRTSVY